MSSNEPRLELALAAAGMGVWERDLRTNRIVRSPRVDEMFGFAPGEVGDDANPFLARIPADDLRHMMERLAHVGGTNALQEVEFRVSRPDGSTRWLRASGEVERDASGQVVLIRSVLADITERKEMEEMLRSAVAEKQALVGRQQSLLKEVHHRVLNNFQMLSSLLSLQRRTAETVEAQRQLDNARGRMQSLAVLFRRLYRSGTFESIEFGPLLQELAGDISRALARGAGVRAKVEVRASSASLASDRAMLLSLIVYELLTNALRHAFPDLRDGNVVVSFDADDEGGCRLEVSDDGVGLPDQFDEGARGLGLRLVRQFATQAGGRLTIGAGKPGARFAVVLPPARQPEK